MAWIASAGPWIIKHSFKAHGDQGTWFAAGWSRTPGSEPLAASSRHTERKCPMSKTAQKSIGDIAPKLAQLTDEVLFDDVWERPQLSKRDRSLITCAALVSTGKTEQMSFHFPRAIENGVTQDELVEMITQLAFYVGWPSAMSAINKVKELLGNNQPRFQEK
jgi:4-carboxymuconolactone decarboxylase